MSRSTLASWTPGTTNARHVITALEPDEDDQRTIPFVGLVEATVVRAFRETGLPMQRIRRALQVLADQGELEHALASRQLYSDGAEILYDYARSHSDKQLSLLTVVHTGQRVFHDVIRSYLDRISFEGTDEWASELVLPVTERPLLRVVPDVSNGEPLFIEGGAPLSAIHSRIKAGEPLKSVAHDYGVTANDVEEALHAVWPQKEAA